MGPQIPAPPPVANDSVRCFYRLRYPLQTESPPEIPICRPRVARTSHIVAIVWDIYDVARCRISLKVAKIISMTTNANPIRKPTSWARSDNGRPRTASMA